MGGAAGEKQLVCEGWAEFLNYLIPVSAPRLKVGVPVFPGDSGNAPLPFTPPPAPHVLAALREGTAGTEPFEYEGGVYPRRSVAEPPGLVIHGMATDTERLEGWRGSARQDGGPRRL